MSRPIRILLIEDNPGDSRLIREMLGEAQHVSFSVECCQSLDCALRRLEEDKVDVVLSDLGLPDSQGIDTYRELHTRFPELPIVVLSGLDDESLALRAVRSGAQDYLVKGRIDGKLLARSIRYAIERVSTEAALREAYRELEREVVRRQKAESELIVNHEKLRNLFINLQSMREEERTNIAREIHDELGQVMAAIKMNVSWIKSKYRDHQGISEKTSDALDQIDSTIKAIKRICTELRPGILDHLGIAAAISWQAEEFQKRTGIVCDVSADEEIQLGMERSTALFRIFQEALTNIIRHANATRVSISLKAEENIITMTVKDNGRGISDDAISKPNSFGLLGMRERVYPWKGRVNISGGPGRGTSIEVIILGT